MEEGVLWGRVWAATDVRRDEEPRDEDLDLAERAVVCCGVERAGGSEATWSESCAINTTR